MTPPTLPHTLLLGKALWVEHHSILGPLGLDKDLGVSELWFRPAHITANVCFIETVNSSSQGEFRWSKSLCQKWREKETGHSQKCCRWDGVLIPKFAHTALLSVLKFWWQPWLANYWNSLLMFVLPDGTLENRNFQGDCAERSLGELVSSHLKPLTPCLGINSRGNKMAKRFSSICHLDRSHQIHLIYMLGLEGVRNEGWRWMTCCSSAVCLGTVLPVRGRTQVWKCLGIASVEATSPVLGNIQYAQLSVLSLFLHSLTGKD